MCSTQRTRQVMCFILELWEKEGKVSKDLLMPMVAAGYDLSLAFFLLRVAVLRYWSPHLELCFPSTLSATIAVTALSPNSFDPTRLDLI